MKRLSGWDAMMLYSETPNIHMHTVKVAVVDATHVDGDYDLDRFRQTVRKRLPGLDPLSYQLVDIPFKFHHPMCWRTCRWTWTITYAGPTCAVPEGAASSMN